MLSLYKKYEPDHFIIYSGWNDSFQHLNSNELDINISRYEKIQSEPTIPDFLKFIDQLESFDVETKRGAKGSNSVQVSTIHQSKGLEFKVVFVIDVAQGRIPGRYTQKQFFVPLELAKGVKPAAEPKEEFIREERRFLFCLFLNFVKYGLLLGPSIP